MNGRKLTTISTLVSGVAAAALLAGTLSGGGPRAYASQMATIGGTANSGIQVQNLSTSPATVQMDLYPQGGGTPTSLTRTNVAGESSADFYLPSENTVAAGSYGVVLSSNQQIAAIARTEWLSSGRTGAAAYGTVAPAQNVVLPSLLGPTAAAPGGFANQVSQFSVQNAGTSGNATVVVDIFREGNATAIKSIPLSIPAGTSQTLKMGVAPLDNLPDTQTSPRGFVGYARVSSNSASNPLVVQTFVDFTNSSTAVYAYSGVPTTAAATNLFAPLVRRDYFGTTGMQLVNPGGTVANVTITYYTDPNSPQKLTGPGQTATETVQIQPNSSLGVYQGPRPGNPLPDPDAGAGRISNNNGYFGSAKIVSSQPIVGIVNDAVINDQFATRTSAAYNLTSSADGGTKIFTPLVRNAHTARRLTTGVTIQNIGGSATNVTLTARTSGGAAVAPVTINNVAPGASVSIFQGAATTPFPAGQFGSAVVTSSGQPIAVIVNDASFTNPLSLDAAIYNGLK